MKHEKALLHNHRDTAPVLTMVYCLVVNGGYASALWEFVFPSLARVDAPQRRGHTTKWETYLTQLHFERKTLIQLQFYES